MFPLLRLISSILGFFSFEFRQWIEWMMERWLSNHGKDELRIAIVIITIGLLSVVSIQNMWIQPKWETFVPAMPEIPLLALARNLRWSCTAALAANAWLRRMNKDGVGRVRRINKDWVGRVRKMNKHGKKREWWGLMKQDGVWKCRVGEMKVG